MAATMLRSGFQNNNENNDRPREYPLSSIEKELHASNALIQNLNEFYKDQEIIIENIPAGTPESEVRSFLGDFDAKQLNLLEKERQANVVLESGSQVVEFLTEMRKSAHSSLHVSLKPTDHLLCIAHLPHCISDQQFHNLLSEYGAFTRCLVYKSVETESSKWYGFVDFDAPLEQVKDIQKDLDWKDINGVQVHCDFISTTLNYYSQLNSKCLFVDNLPKDYCDTSEFREIFSCHTSPLYCQVVMKDGESLGYGIIEYKTCEEAEKSEQTLNGYKIKDVAIRITYCIPGLSAVAICTRLMNRHEKYDAQSKPSLLPDPICPSKDIVNHPLIHQLHKQHPSLISKFDQCLQELQKMYVRQLTSKTEKPGLLGPAPVMPMNPLMNYNLQFGLVVLLALQLQCQAPSQVAWQVNLMDLLWQHVENTDESESSLLGDPVSAQANIILQNLMSQAVPHENSCDDNSSPQKMVEKSVSSMLQSLSKNIQSINLKSLVNLGQLALQLNSGHSQPTGLLGNGPQLLHQNGQKKLPSLLDFDPEGFGINSGKGSGADGLLGAAPPNVAPNTGQNFLHNLNMYAKNKGQMYATGGIPQLQDTNKMLGGGNSLLGEPPQEVRNWRMKQDQGFMSNEMYNRSYDVNRNSSGKRKLEESFPQQYDQGYYDEYESYGNYDQGCYDDYNNYGNYTQESNNYNYSRQQGTQSLQGNKYQDMASKAAAYAATNSYNNNPGYNQFGSTDYSGSNISYQDDSFSSGYNSTRSYDDSFNSGRGSVSDYGYNFQSNPTNFDFSSMKPPTSRGPMSQMNNSSKVARPGIVQRTPQGQKRSYSQLLPPPEPSPEGDYIGQHSQGIGGHYAESYSNKRRKLDNFGRMLQY